MRFWLTQLPNVLGFLGMYFAGRKRRVGWLLGAASELAWALLAYVADLPGMYLWCVIWGVVYLRNYWLWRQGDMDAIPTGSRPQGEAGDG